MARSTFAGFCLTAFACGIVSTVAIDRILPRSGDEDTTRAEPAPAPNAAMLQAPKPPEIAELPAHAIAPESDVTTRAPTAIAPTPPPPAAARPSSAPMRKRPAALHAPTVEETTRQPSADDAPGKTGITTAKKRWADPFE